MNGNVLLLNTIKIFQPRIELELQFDESFLSFTWSKNQQVTQLFLLRSGRQKSISKIEARADASGEVDSTDLGIDIDDDLVAFSEDNEDNDEPQETSTNKAATYKEASGANSAAAAVNCAGFTAGARFYRPMVSTRIKDRHVSNNLEKILTPVSTHFLQKAKKSDTEEIQRQQQQQSMMMMHVDHVIHVHPCRTTGYQKEPIPMPALNPFRQ